jgi:hypothetical protein
LPEDEQTSKHGGGARYNAVLEFKGEQIKKIWWEKKKRKKWERERKEKIYVWETNMSMYDIKIK